MVDIDTTRLEATALLEQAIQELKLERSSKLAVVVEPDSPASVIGGLLLFVFWTAYVLATLAGALMFGGLFLGGSLFLAIALISSVGGDEATSCYGVDPQA